MGYIFKYPPSIDPLKIGIARNLSYYRSSHFTDEKSRLKWSMTGLRAQSTLTAEQARGVSVPSCICFHARPIQSTFNKAAIYFFKSLTQIVSLFCSDSSISSPFHSE